MSLLHPAPVVHRPSFVSQLVGPALMVGLAAVLVGAGFAMGASGEPHVVREAAADPCALPAGVDLEVLEASDRVPLVRRVLACRDHASGMISREQYQRAIAEIDRAWTAPVAQPEVQIAKVEPIWASSVRGFSTQYSAESWSAQRALGAPDVFPASGDHENAWASASADDRPEWIEVGYAQPARISGLEIYETFNPGAIGRVELVTTSGKRIEVAMTRATGESARNAKAFACTAEPIAAVRVHVDSTSVDGWNEIDAIGVVPCR